MLAWPVATISSPHLWIFIHGNMLKQSCTVKILKTSTTESTGFELPSLSGGNALGKNVWDSLSFSLLGLPTKAFCATCWLLDLEYLSALLQSRRVMNCEFLNYKFSKSWTGRVGLMLAWPVATKCSPHLCIFIHGYVETVVYSKNIQNIDN